MSMQRGRWVVEKAGREEERVAPSTNATGETQGRQKSGCLDGYWMVNSVKTCSGVDSFGGFGVW